jgi:hypothetical protein
MPVASSMRSRASMSARPRARHTYILIALLLVPLMIGTKPAHSQASGAGTQCEVVDEFGDQECVTSISIAQFAPAYQQQQQTEWCWAASIAMIFAYYGHPVTQSQIVTGQLGELINQAGQPWQIFQAMNGSYTDDNGVKFNSVVTGLYDVLDHYDNISYTDIGAALNQGEPVLIGTENPDGSGAHATVLSAIEYAVPYGDPVEVASDGSNIIAATVFDPWPTSAGLVTLYPPQILPASLDGGVFFAAITQVTASSSTSNGTSTSSGSNGGGGGALDLLSLALTASLVACGLKRKLRRRSVD